MTTYHNHAVLWDMDGVLVDTAEYHFQSWKVSLEELGITLNREDFIKTFGMNNAGILEIVFGRKPEPDELNRIDIRKESLFRDLIKGKAEPLPGVLFWLRQFKDWGVKQAITSSAPPENIEFLVNELMIKEYFNVLISGSDLPGKPNPDVFLKAASHFRVLPENCIVVEDAVAGVEGAKRAGMKCIAVTTTNPAGALEKADLILDNLEDLSKEVFLSLLNKKIK
jgi:HAD superfamily hydrolase (TIGR01509 family)